MPDVSSTAPAQVRMWVAIDQHKLSLVAAMLPASGGQPEVVRVENTERAIRRFLQRLGGAEGLAVAYEAGPGGYELHRLLSSMGVACDVIAPSLIRVSWAGTVGDCPCLAEITMAVRSASPWAASSVTNRPIWASTEESAPARTGPGVTPSARYPPG